MITNEQYFGAKPHTEQQEAEAARLLVQVNMLLMEYQAASARGPDIDPDTGTEISGSKGGSGDGGFRLDTATTGRTGSSHKVLPADAPKGAGVDCSDQDNGLDEWLDQFEHGDGDNSKLAQYDLYREHPSATPTWCHLTNRAPASGKRTFYP
jgi:hypothetical protein